MSALQPGEVLCNRYTVSKLIGRGSMADVYEAEDAAETRRVALKVLRLRAARDRDSLRRFSREARVQEMIDHRNVARLFGSGVTDRGEPFLVVELLRGRSLRHILREGPGPNVRRAASYAWQALSGLAAIHAAGVLHRDLKPANLMLEPSPGPVERVVLIDFGFAALEGAERLTAQGTVVGSLAYLAPERLLGEPGDERSDLYGVGVILYELLVGARPFVADSDMALIDLKLDASPLPPRAANPAAAIPPAIEAVILRALARDPAARPPSAAAMADELEHAVHQGTGSPPLSI